MCGSGFIGFRVYGVQGLGYLLGLEIFASSSAGSPLSCVESRVLYERASLALCTSSG